MRPHLPIPKSGKGKPRRRRVQSPPSWGRCRRSRKRGAPREMRPYLPSPSRVKGKPRRRRHRSPPLRGRCPIGQRGAPREMRPPFFLLSLEEGWSADPTRSAPTNAPHPEVRARAILLCDHESRRASLEGRTRSPHPFSPSTRRVQISAHGPPKEAPTSPSCFASPLSPRPVGKVGRDREAPTPPISPLRGRCPPLDESSGGQRRVRRVVHPASVSSIVRFRPQVSHSGWTRGRSKPADRSTLQCEDIGGVRVMADI